jgi:putative addiction module antidote
MSFTAKIEQHGDDLFISLPEEALTHLRAKVGDSLELVRTPDGLLLHYHDAEFSKQMAAARIIMEQNREVLRRLAE